MKFLKKLFGISPKLTTYERPILFAHSDLAGFTDLITVPININLLLSYVMIYPESEIPLSHTYFKYIGDGEFIKTIKHDLTPQGSGVVAANLSPEIRTWMNDYAMNSGKFSRKYIKTDLISIAFELRQEML